MKAIEIIQLIRAIGADTNEEILAVLGDGETLAVLGITDDDQTEVEHAYDMLLN